MKRIPFFILTILFILSTPFIFGQNLIELGDLPKSEYIISIYQVIAFQGSAEGYKLIYIGPDNEPNSLYLPIELRDKYGVYSPQNNTLDQNFVILWKKGDRITRIDWFLPVVINYRLPFYSIKPFREKDKEIFKAIAAKGEFILGTEIPGVAPVITAPGGSE